MPDTTITIDILRQWGACYLDAGEVGEDTLRAFFPGRESVTLREIADNDAISHDHRMWVLTHALWHRDPWLCYDFALWVAEQAIQHVEPEWRERAKATLDGVRGLRAGAAWADRAAEAVWAARDAEAAEAVWAAGAAGAAEAARAAAEKLMRDHAVEMLEMP